jgi:hypothetical protein
MKVPDEVEVINIGSSIQFLVSGDKTAFKIVFPQGEHVVVSIAGAAFLAEKITEAIKIMAISREL